MCAVCGGNQSTQTTCESESCSTRRGSSDVVYQLGSPIPKKDSKACQVCDLGLICLAMKGARTWEEKKEKKPLTFVQTVRYGWYVSRKTGGKKTGASTNVYRVTWCTCRYTLQTTHTWRRVAPLSLQKSSNTECLRIACCGLNSGHGTPSLRLREYPSVLPV